jgi:hypothetical protein
MNIRLLIWLSLALNLALAVGMFRLSNRPPPVPNVTQTQMLQLPVADPAERATNADTAAPQRRPTTNRSFHWNQVASDDLKIYRDNLRAIGCPPLTVHDIILAEINERFEKRRQVLLAELQSRFWDFAIHGETAIRNEWGRPIDELAAERRNVINDVLGEKDYGIAEAEAQAGRESMLRHLSWLPAEKRDRLLALELGHQQQMEDWTKSAGQRTDGKLTAEDQARLQALQKEFDDARKELLSPEELEESRLRSSRGSLWAMGLSGFEATEAEWRAVTKLRVDLDEAQRDLAGAELTDDERNRRRETLQAQLQQALKDALGQKRFSQYELAANAEFRDVRKVTQRYGLPDSVAFQAYELRQGAFSEIQWARNDPTRSAENRQSALNAIQQQTERALAKVLGEKVFSTYKEYGGDWLTELSQNGNE